MTRRERLRLYADAHFTAPDPGLVLPARRSGSGLRRPGLARLARLSRLVERAGYRQHR
ncbi:hypothetical protein ABZW03_38515 [Kitasatospora sp. NPDC004799]|uniref:hypothetical protein n=1 Tax=Kitasatospora sp. NPDC004799 TaxID=3154460 RepID=UPI0033B3146A